MTDLQSAIRNPRSAIYTLPYASTRLARPPVSLVSPAKEVSSPALLGSLLDKGICLIKLSECRVNP
jgi:hypothetical protein